jgi:AcrR family transcriptional regulator
MRIRKQPTDRMRKSPTQGRPQETVDIIFGAAARILEHDGRGGFNTNAVAELAGFSIRTLYHYFPNKDAILIEMARRELRVHASLRGGRHASLFTDVDVLGGWDLVIGME